MVAGERWWWRFWWRRGSWTYTMGSNCLACYFDYLGLSIVWISCRCYPGNVYCNICLQYTLCKFLPQLMFPLVQKFRWKFIHVTFWTLLYLGIRLGLRVFISCVMLFFSCGFTLPIWSPLLSWNLLQFHGFINHTSQKNFTSSTANLVWHLNLLVQRIPSFSKKFTKNENYLSGGFTIIRRLQWFHGEKPFVINYVWDFCADLSCFCSKSSCCVFILAFLYNWFT